MSVRIARYSGFCFGVKRAIKIAQEAAKTNHEIVTLGPIIHNPQMVSRLEQEGVINVSSIEELRGRPTIIRSHGVGRDIMENLRRQNVEIIDATCPYVSKTQDVARKLSEDGYRVIILGDKDHPEVTALRSYVSGDVIIVNNAGELKSEKFGRVGLIAQTTKSSEDFNKLIEVLKPLCSELKVVNTICNATAVRQNATLRLARESDVMIVVGGRNSSNTKMLAKISENFVETYHIETAGEINAKWFKNKVNIGLTAGASTPDWIIVEVYNRINKCMGNVESKAKSIEDIPGFKEEK